LGTTDVIGRAAGLFPEIPGCAEEAGRGTVTIS
jgi:hypothetical protein